MIGVSLAICAAAVLWIAAAIDLVVLALGATAWVAKMSGRCAVAIVWLLLERAGLTDSSGGGKTTLAEGPWWAG